MNSVLGDRHNKQVTEAFCEDPVGLTHSKGEMEKLYVLPFKSNSILWALMPHILQETPNVVCDLILTVVS